jgi:hypothetical protein
MKTIHFGTSVTAHGNVQNGDNCLKDFALQYRFEMPKGLNHLRDELISPLWRQDAVPIMKFIHIRMNCISQGAA